MPLHKRQVYIVWTSPESKERIAKGLCPVCSKPKSEWTRRKDWSCCSTECTQKYQDEHHFLASQQKMKELALRKAGNRCEVCGAQPTVRSHHCYSDDIVIDEKPDENQMVLLLDTSRLIADHKIPIALGGEEFDIGNIQILCDVCNKKKTRKDIEDIAKVRRADKEVVEKQEFRKKQHDLGRWVG